VEQGGKKRPFGRGELGLVDPTLQNGELMA
jgi:hypothetical protein